MFQNEIQFIDNHFEMAIFENRLNFVK